MSRSPVQSILDDTGDNFRLAEPNGVGQATHSVISQHREAFEGCQSALKNDEKPLNLPRHITYITQDSDPRMTQKTTLTSRQDDTGDVVCFGEVLLRLASPGKELLLQSPQLQTHVGGAEANVAVSLCKFGHRTRMISALPDSTLGHACASELRRHGVDTASLHFSDGRLGLYFLTHGAGHRPAEVLYDRAASAFASQRAETYDWPVLLSTARWLHVSGITPAVSASAASAALHAMQTAAERAVPVSFDCNFRSRLWGERSEQAPQVLLELCKHAQVIFGDERDIAFMMALTADAASMTRRAAADIAFERWSKLQVMACTERTRHSVEVQQLRGELYTREASHQSRQYSLPNIVDRIGAGDAFAAGVLHGLLHQQSAQDTVEFATAAACLKHSIPGDFNLATLSDVALLLSEGGGDVRR